ncbi:hypothetical protein Taro_025692 [Colocasia esculenta]|uniref:Uncharacterized protein n=1 Tax=Colocasia esculenta TaxID=4460 RepID=A0A843VAV2_COLES|nr:hypothetical protein [Colocasia esculenta]
MAPTGTPFLASLRDVPSHSLNTFAYKKAKVTSMQRLPSAPAIVFPSSTKEVRLAQAQTGKHHHSLAPSVGTNERPCALPERLIFMRPAHPYPHWGGCVEVLFSLTLKDSENKCVPISKSLTSTLKRALLKDKTPSMGTIPLGRYT